MVESISPTVKAALHDEAGDIDIVVDATNYLDFLANAGELENYLKNINANHFSLPAPLLLGLFVDADLVRLLQSSKNLLLSLEPYELRRYVAVNYPHYLPLLASLES